MEFGQLLEEANKYLPSDKIPLVEKAYEFAVKAHGEQLRLTGEPVVNHPLETAMVLAKLRLDAASVAAALLHDVLEDCDVTPGDIEAEFGAEVTKLVDGVTKLSSLSWPEGVEKETRRAESLRKMLVAMAEDIRVIFIKLADRLHNMRTLGALPVQRRRRFAKETMEIHVPLAHRLGIWEIKGELEDWAFFYLHPAEYRRIDRLVSKRKTEQDALVARAMGALKEELVKANMSVEISGRTKEFYSIYSKMEKYAKLGKDFGDIHDILALRVVVNEVEDCYHALGIIHSMWRPIAGEFDDYIANPKENGYQSIHTSVMCFGTTPLEIQVRTHVMHHSAEYGVAAHWVYKEGMEAGSQFERRIAWLRQLLEWHREIGGTADFLESVKTDLFNDQVFVYTPKGEIRELPAGSTPLDFAYNIHTELGHRCVGAKVNGRLLPLTYQLRNGDTVEVVAAKGAKAPSRDWLNANLGYVKSSQARTKIRQWFRKQELSENIERGKELLEKELRRLGLHLSSREEIASRFKYDTVEELYSAIGCGEVSTSRIALRLATEEDQPRIAADIAPAVKGGRVDIHVLGVGELLTYLARCCNPLPGDDIIGYITRTRGVSVHRKDCPNVIHTKEEDRLVPVSWGGRHEMYPAVIRIDGWDRVGLLRDITSLVAEERLSITEVSSVKHKDDTISLFITFETKGVVQLSRLLTKMESITGVLNVARCLDSHEKSISPAS